MSTYRQTHRSFHNHTHHHSSSGNHQWRRSNYQSSRQHHDVHNNPGTYYSSFGGGGFYTAVDHEQFWYQYQTPVFQPPLPYYLVDMILPSVVVNNHSPYGPMLSYPVPYYELIDDHIVVAADPRDSMVNSEMLDYINFMTSQLIDQERDSSDYLFYPLDDIDGHDEEKEDDDDVFKYLKIRTAKEGVNPKVAADVESEICAICQSEFEHEESIGTLHCGHEYHMNCIKQWLLRKKDCPMCRASVLPPQG